MTKYENLKRSIKARKEAAEKYAKESFQLWLNCENKETKDLFREDWIRYDMIAKILKHILEEEE